MRFTDARAAAGRTAMNVADSVFGAAVDVEGDTYMVTPVQGGPVTVFVAPYDDGSGFTVWAVVHTSHPTGNVSKRRQFRADEDGIRLAADFARDLIVDARVAVTPV